MSKSKDFETNNFTLSSITIHRFPPLNYDLFQNINDLPFTAHKDANSLAIFIPRGFGESGMAICYSSGIRETERISGSILFNI